MHDSIFFFFFLHMTELISTPRINIWDQRENSFWAPSFLPQTPSRTVGHSVDLKVISWNRWLIVPEFSSSFLLQTWFLNLSRDPPWARRGRFNIKMDPLWYQILLSYKYQMLSILIKIPISVVAWSIKYLWFASKSYQTGNWVNWRLVECWSPIWVFHKRRCQHFKMKLKDSIYIWNEVLLNEKIHLPPHPQIQNYQQQKAPSHHFPSETWVKIK